MSEKSFIRWISSFVLFSLCCFSSFGQGVGEVLQNAERYFEQEDYENALLEYQRAWVFNDIDSINTDIFLKISDIYTIKGTNTLKALEFRELAYKSERGSRKNQILLETIPLYIKSQQYETAFKALIGMRAADDEQRTQQQLYLGIISFQLENYDDSETYFKDIAQDTAGISEMFNTKKLYRPKPKTAKILSVMVPGAGQLYAGDLGNALNSTLLVGGLAYLGVLVYQHYSLLNVALGVVPVFQRYYFGGVKNAGQVALEKRNTKRKKVLLDVLDQIKTEQTSTLSGK